MITQPSRDVWPSTGHRWQKNSGWSNIDLKLMFILYTVYYGSSTVSLSNAKIKWQDMLKWTGHSGRIVCGAAVCAHWLHTHIGGGSLVRKNVPPLKPPSLCLMPGSMVRTYKGEVTQEVQINQITHRYLQISFCERVLIFPKALRPFRSCQI